MRTACKIASRFLLVATFQMDISEKNENPVIVIYEHHPTRNGLIYNIREEKIRSR